MLEATLTSLLVSVAGRYAHLSPADVGVGLSGGRLVVDDVRLRARALNAPALPFRVVSGRAGRLRVSVPWAALSHAPVSVYLENVHLVARPRSPRAPHTRDDTAPRDDAAAPRKRNAAPWHETLLGRLGFNVAVEVNSLKLEYRTPASVAIVSLASARAFSADAAWNPAFAPLDAGAARAKAMRKVLAITGLHCVMLPRARSAAPADPAAFEARVPILDGLRITLRLLLYAADAHPADHPAHDDAFHIDLAIEVDEPVVNLSARQLEWLRATAARSTTAARHPAPTASRPPRPSRDRSRSRDDVVDAKESDIASETDTVIVVDDAANNTVESDVDTRSETESVLEFAAASRERGPTKRSVQEVAANAAAAAAAAALAADQRGVHPETYISSDGRGEETAGDETSADDATDDLPPSLSADVLLRGQSLDATTRGSTADIASADYAGKRPVGQGEDFSRGGSVSDRFSDDAASNDTQVSDSVQDAPGPTGVDSTRRKSVGSLAAFWSAIVGEETIDEFVDDAAVALGYTTREDREAAHFEELRAATEAGDDVTDLMRSFEAVKVAAASGGYTLHVRLVTPDIVAREKVERLSRELAEERAMRQRLESAESVVADADSRVAAAEQELSSLRRRNAELVTELKDLERMTRAASASKDVMVRQMEAALRKAEQQLQAIAQERMAKHDAESNGRRPELRDVSSMPVLGTVHETHTRKETTGRRTRPPRVDSNETPKSETAVSSVKPSRISATKAREGGERENDEKIPVVRNSDSERTLSRPPRAEKIGEDYVSVALEEACSNDGLTVV